MKKYFFLTLAVFACMFAYAGNPIQPTVIPYNVNYHWGIIDVNIAHGTVKYESDGTNFHGTLDGVSIPWEGHVIVVSDTLKAQFLPGEKYSREKIDYQSGWYRRPKAKYFRSNDYDAANPANYKNIAGEGQYDASNASMEAITITSDMIAMYYYAREIDFESLQPNQQITIPIEGVYAQEVVITYLGKGSYEIENVTYPTYNCMFEYNYKQKMSGYPVQMRIHQTDRIPVFLSASIPVGKVEMIYNP
ncbi:MAG: DUF3108 domain-containing protein [Muribaculaceae bacterium]|nr:DUF3108 domain-containing protein [Muribaculaceae bacterium]